MLGVRWNGMVGRVDRLGASAMLSDVSFGTEQLWRELLVGIDSDGSILSMILRTRGKESLVLLSWAIFQIHTLVLAGLDQMGVSQKAMLYMAFGKVKQTVRDNFNSAVVEQMRQHYDSLNVLLSSIQPIILNTIESVNDVSGLHSIALNQQTKSSEIFRLLTGNSPVVGIVPSPNDIGVHGWEGGGMLIPDHLPMNESNRQVVPAHNGGMQYPPQQPYYPPPQPVYNGVPSYPPRQPVYNGVPSFPPQQPVYNGVPSYQPQQPVYNEAPSLPPPQQPAYNAAPSYPPQQFSQTTTTTTNSYGNGPSPQNVAPVGISDGVTPRIPSPAIQPPSSAARPGSIPSAARPGSTPSIANIAQKVVADQQKKVLPSSAPSSVQPSPTGLKPSIASVTNKVVEQQRQNPSAAITKPAPPAGVKPSIASVTNKVVEQQRQNPSAAITKPAPPAQRPVVAPVAGVRITPSDLPKTMPSMVEIAKKAQAAAAAAKIPTSRPASAPSKPPVITPSLPKTPIPPKPTPPAKVLVQTPPPKPQTPPAKVTVPKPTVAAVLKTVKALQKPVKR
jgi:hypothetical protein